MIKAMLSKAFLAKAGVVLAGLSVGTAGAGAADVLPQVAQDNVAVAVEKVTTLDLPDSHDPPSATEKADDEKPAEPQKSDDGTEKAGEAPKSEKQEKAEKDNLGQTVSGLAHSKDKGPGFGQQVSEAARARHEANPDDETDDGSDGAGGRGSSTSESHRPSDTPAAQANRGSGHRP